MKPKCWNKYKPIFMWTQEFELCNWSSWEWIHADYFLHLFHSYLKKHWEKSWYWFSILVFPHWSYCMFCIRKQTWTKKFHRLLPLLKLWWQRGKKHTHVPKRVEQKWLSWTKLTHVNFFSLCCGALFPYHKPMTSHHQVNIKCASSKDCLQHVSAFLRVPDPVARAHLKKHILTVKQLDYSLNN